MLLGPPKLVCLDTSTWGNLARDLAHDGLARHAVELIQDHPLVPFITWHHLAELVQHGNDDVVRSRIDLLRSLKFVAFPRLPEESAHVGSFLNVRDAELSVLLKEPEASHSQIIQCARATVTNGFTSGDDFCRANEEWWLFYRQRFSDQVQQQHAKIAALTHFPSKNMGKVVSGELGKYTLSSSEQAARHFTELATKLTLWLQSNVKKPLPNPEEIAFDLMQEAYNDGEDDYGSEKEGIDWLLRRYGVSRERLPANATPDDMGCEAVFIKQLSVHERRLGMPPGSLKQVARKEMLPSWSVWQGLDRAIRRLPKAETGNLNDKAIATFGPYVDYIQLDKRIRHCVAELAPKSELFASIKGRLLGGGDHASLVRELEVARTN